MPKVKEQTESPDFSRGLEDVIAGESSICFIDGEKARLLYRGYDIRDLVTYCSFEEVVYLLWFGELPNKKQLEEFSGRLSEERNLTPQVLDFLKSCPYAAQPMSVLRTAVSVMGLYDPEAEDNGRSACINKGIRLISRVPTIVAAFHRIRTGQDVISPRQESGLAEHFLYMLNGEAPDEISKKALDAYFVLLADHEFNASAFAARTTAATLSDLHSAIVSAIGTLKGDLHGSANRRAMEMLIEIQDASHVRSYIEKLFSQKKKLMGFGHRVYTVRDPRAEPLAELARKLGEKKSNMTWYEISEELEKVAEEKKGLYANVDLYSASVLALAGIPVDMFTCMFAVSRLSGWIAHVLEQLADNRLIRPRAIYTGPTQLKLIPLEKRK